VAGLWSPKTGIVDYTAVSQTYARIVEEKGGEVRLGAKVIGLTPTPDGLAVQTNLGDLRTRALINCAGLQSDKIARMAGDRHGLRIIPFRGEYYELTPESQALVRGLIYPVPDPAFPFLGVHFTKKINGSVEAGPNAVLAFAREGYKKTSFNPGHVLGVLGFRGFWIMGARYWRMGLGEMYRSWSKRAFVAALRTLLPELGMDDIHPGGAGVRAQALDSGGNLLEDFSFVETPHAVHVLNAPSPAATVSIVIGKTVADRALDSFGME
jgi:L-2-hydroxyglutarate oxidase LhgO